jgi:hypothetical protein
MDRSVLRLPDTLERPHRTERRRSVRQKLHTPVYVSFNVPQSGMVVDLSELLDLHEYGFSVQTAGPSTGDTTNEIQVNGAVTLSLDLPETKKIVHGTGEVVWIDTKGRAGIQFSFLPEAGRQVLKEWLFANLLIASANHTARAEQLARREQEESLPDGSTTPGSSSGEASPATSPVLVPNSSNRMSGNFTGVSELLEGPTSGRESRESETKADEVDLRTREALQTIVEEALAVTGATGAALGLLTDGKMLCRAMVGDPAPPLKSEVDSKSGLSGECIRTGLPVSCEDATTDPRVDPEVCRILGIGSLMAVPIFSNFRVVGLLEIFSPNARAFTPVHGSILERLVMSDPKISAQQIDERKAQEEPEANLEWQKASEMSDLAATDSARSEPTAMVDVVDEPGFDIALRSARHSHLTHVALLLLVLGTVALVMGYLLAPTIERYWANSSKQNPGISADASVPLQSAAGRSHPTAPAEVRRLADQGDADAQWQLGVLYHDGEGVPKDDTQAVQWFQRAAEQGYVRAQSTLGAYYWAGRGVPQDFSKAYFWSQLALAQGDEISKSRLEGLAAQMTPSQVAKARQQAELWLHSHTQAANSKGPKPTSE